MLPQRLVASGAVSELSEFSQKGMGPDMILLPLHMAGDSGWSLLSQAIFSKMAASVQVGKEGFPSFRQNHILKLLPSQKTRG